MTQLASFEVCDLDDTGGGPRWRQGLRSVGCVSQEVFNGHLGVEGDILWQEAGSPPASLRRRSRHAR